MLASPGSVTVQLTPASLESLGVGVRALGAERIDHGVAIVEDPALVQRLADERIPLTVCPTSYVVIANRYASLADHPFRAMRDAGLLLTINTDDPAMTDLDIGREYQAVADEATAPFEVSGSRRLVAAVLREDDGRAHHSRADERRGEKEKGCQLRASSSSSP